MKDEKKATSGTEKPVADDESDTELLEEFEENRLDRLIVPLSNLALSLRNTLLWTSYNMLIVKRVNLRKLNQILTQML